MPVIGTDLLAFAGIEPLEHPIYPAEAHVAEKLHALTLEHSAPNSRVKDLVDLGLLAAHVEFEAGTLRESIDATFDFRNTHPVPGSLPEPPDFWHGRYLKMRATDDLPWVDLDALQTLCADFIHPVLNATAAAQQSWSITNRRWH